MDISRAMVSQQNSFQNWFHNNSQEIIFSLHYEHLHLRDLFQKLNVSAENGWQSMLVHKVLAVAD